MPPIRMCLEPQKSLIWVSEFKLSTRNGYLFDLQGKGLLNLAFAMLDFYRFSSETWLVATLSLHIGHLMGT